MPRTLIRLVSTALNKNGKKTGTFRVTSKNPKLGADKLERKCFDKNAHDPKTGKTGKHAVFKEEKIK